MRIAITGGTGFVGRHLAALLAPAGHEVVLVARGVDRRGGDEPHGSGVRLERVSVGDLEGLSRAFAGCEAVAHCAGINREIGAQTYHAVHVEGTRNVVRAAEGSGVRRLAMVSFLRARPDCGSGYHESKWAAEQIVRASTLQTTILKCGVIYGRGDHMLDHLSHALHTFPVFALVGLHDRPVRPVAVEDVAAILASALCDGTLAGRTVAVLGPEELLLGEAVRRVAKVLGKRPIFVRTPVAFHYALAWVLERIMSIPLVAVAQVRILSEGVVEPILAPDPLPERLRPTRTFSEPQIRAGLPPPGGSGLADLRPCSRGRPAR